MADIVTTNQNDVLDLLVRIKYGDESGFVAKVLEANPGLAALGPVLPMNTKIVFPDLEIPDPEFPVVTLYD